MQSCHCPKDHAVKYKGRRSTLALLGHVPSDEYSTGPRVCSSPLPPQCLTQRTISVIQNLESMRSRIKVWICSSTTASSSLPSVDDHSYPPIASPAQQDRSQPGESNFSDGSEALFSMYLRRAKEEDYKMVESWKKYADGMLTFVSLRAPSHSSHIM
jgi:hypothetical protein